MCNKIVRYEQQSRRGKNYFRLASVRRSLLLFSYVVFVRCGEQQPLSADSKLTTGHGGSDDFYHLITADNDFYIDKTSMIEEFLTRKDKISRIVRPSGWGKTINLSTLKTFLQLEIDSTGKPPSQKTERKNFKLFAGGTVDLGYGKKRELKSLNVADSKFALKHQGKYPILWIDFKNIVRSDYEDVIIDLKKSISDLYERHSYLNANVPSETKNNFTAFRDGDYNDNELTVSFRILTGLMYDHFKRKVYVFVDDYDRPLTAAFSLTVDLYRSRYVNYPDWIIFAKVAKSKRFRSIRRLFKRLLGETLEDNPAVERSIISGVYSLTFFDPVVRSLSNVIDYGLLNETYRRYYGLTDEELQSELEIDKSKVRESLRLRYGYNLTGQVVYNPLLIKNYLKNDNKFEIINNNNDSSSNNDEREDSTDLLTKQITLTENIQDSLQRLIDGQTVTSKIYGNLKYGTMANDLTALLSAGYLNALSCEEEEDKRCTLTIANEETAVIFRRRMSEWIRLKLNVTVSDFSMMANSMLLDDKTDGLTDKLRSYLATVHFHKNEDYTDEIYKGIIRGLAYSFDERDYKVESFRDADNDDKVTVMILSKRKKIPRALLMEYRLVNETATMESIAKESIMQIDYRLDSDVKHRFTYIKHIVKIVFVFCKRTVVVERKVDT